MFTSLLPSFSPTIFYGTAMGAAGLYLWEFIGRKRNSEVKPSVFLNYLAVLSAKFFTKTGQLLAKISSFYTLINLKDLVDPLHDLAKPSWKLMTSWFEIFKGYWQIASSYKWPITYLCGSATLIVVIGNIGYRYLNYGYPNGLLDLLKNND